MDLRFALRTLFKNPAITVLSIVVLALGIGANTAIFSVVNAVLLRPLDYRDPDRIVTLWTDFRRTGGRGQVSAPDFHDWRSRATSFETMAYHIGGETAVTVKGTADYANVKRVTPGFFSAVGVAPALGRLFSADEERAGFAAVISHRFFLKHFAGSQGVPAQPLQILDRSFPIVGVLPEAFQFAGNTDVFLPSSVLPETTSRTAHNYRVIARLKDGATLEQAQAEMNIIADQLGAEHPKENREKGINVVPLKEQTVSNVKLTLYVLLGAVAAILLIACANVANLLLAKASARTREIAIRAAVGASRGRIIRQLITESLLLGLIAGVAGLLLSFWGVEVLLAIAPAGIPRLEQTGVDWQVLAFTLIASILASLLFGLAPAWTASRMDLQNALKQAARTSTGGSSALRSGLVVAEIAMSVILLTAAGLLIRSFQTLTSVDMGVETSRLLLMEATVPSMGLEAAKRASGFYQDLLPKIRGLNGVTAAAAVLGLPTASKSNGGYLVEGSGTAEFVGIPKEQAIFNVVTPEYFRTMGIALRGGRDFNDRDQFEVAPVAIVNEALARASFAGSDPIGRRLKCGLDRPDWMTIVGVVADSRQDPARPARPEIFMPYRQHPFFATSMVVVARVNGDTELLAEPIRRLAREINSDVPVRFKTMDQAMSTAVATPRFRTLLLSVFAGLAVLLAMTGIYGVMSYAVTQRAPEIGLRMALGARASDVLSMILKNGLRLAVIGLALGLLGGWAASQWLESMLFSVTRYDPLTYLAVIVSILAITWLACWIPARRASRVDPLIALRQD
ncbi:MAG: ABC transporter permease [Bryobacteraceae bacterium]|nr:ABC transporter permease [Bryobacteraceae bacterium]